MEATTVEAGRRGFQRPGRALVVGMVVLVGVLPSAPARAGSTDAGPTGAGSARTGAARTGAARTEAERTEAERTEAERTGTARTEATTADPAATALPGPSIGATVGAASAARSGTKAGADPAARSASVGGPYSLPVPLPLRVARPFVAPASAYGPGHRGVDLLVAPRARIVSPAAGRVTFAGSVAGRGVLVIAHAGGVLTEYEPVRSLVGRGAVVARGQPVAVLDGTDADCGRPDCLHWGARRDGNYVDPLLLVYALGPVRLLPWR